MSADDAELDALQRHPECKYAEVVNGLDPLWNLTWVVKLWRTAECALAGDPPRHVVEGPYYQRDRITVLRDNQ